MKERNYILKEIKKQLKNKKQIENGYAEVFYTLLLNHYNFSYSDFEWINKDNIFTDQSEVLRAFYDILGITENNIHNLPLSSVIGTSLGSKKINNFITDENKKAKLLNYKNYLVCDYENLSSGDYLNGAYYIDGKEIDNLIVIAIKNKSEKKQNIINIYEECGFSVVELKNNKVNNINDALKSARKSKIPYLIIVNNTSSLDEDEFEVFNMVNQVKLRVSQMYKKWLLEYDKEINDRHEKILEIINYLKNPFTGIDLENIQYNLDASYENSITGSSDKIFGIIKNKSKYVSLVEVKNSRLASFLAIGLSISGLKPNVEIKDFASVSDIISISNENNYSVNFILKNTDEEVYLKNLNIYTPSDMHEVIGVWSSVLKNDQTSLLILSNKETTLIKNTNLKYVKYGAYMIKKEDGILDGIISSSGEDLKLALGVAGLLEKEGINLRVVTVPCANLLLKQQKYCKELLTRKVKVFALDKHTNIIYNKFVSNDDCLISSDLGLDKAKEKIKEQLGV